MEQINRTIEMETVIDVAINLGQQFGADSGMMGYFPDSRSWTDTVLLWANEFNTLHESTDWDEQDYIETVDEFFARKFKEHVDAEG